MPAQIRELIKTFSAIKNRYELLLLRRFASFTLDLAILTVVSVGIAVGSFTIGFDIFAPGTAITLLFSYFLVSRFIASGNTLGMRSCKIGFLFNGPAFNRTRLLYRFLLGVLLLILPLDFISIIQYFVPFSFSEFGISLLAYSFCSSVPFFNLFTILFSGGAVSMIDRISGCRMAGHPVNSAKLVTSARGREVRQYLGGYLILVAAVYLLALLINWRFDLRVLFSSKTFEPVFQNPIDRTGRSSVFYEFTKTGHPAFAVITQRSDFLVPYLTSENHNMLEVSMDIPNDQFDNKELHQKIAVEVEITRRLYNLYYHAEIYQSRLCLRRAGSFGPFAIISEYKYILTPNHEGGLRVVGDLSREEKRRVLEDMSVKAGSAESNDTLKIRVTYQGFFEAKPEKYVLVQLMSNYLTEPGFGVHIRPDGSVKTQDD